MKSDPGFNDCKEGGYGRVRPNERKRGESEGMAKKEITRKTKIFNQQKTKRGRKNEGSREGGAGKGPVNAKGQKRVRRVWKGVTKRENKEKKNQRAALNADEGGARGCCCGRGC